MKFGFVTCVQLGLACIEEIYLAGGKLDLIITLPNDVAAKKSGRVYLDDFCRENQIELVKVRHVNDDESIRAIKEREIDWLFVIGWSQIAGQTALNQPARGVLGIHPTLLPEGRGRAPIPNAIIKNLKQTGVTLFKLDAGVDTGEILAQEILPIAPDETATTLYKRVDEAHRTIIRRVWRDLENDNLKFMKQDESKATIWAARKPEDGRISPEMKVAEVDRLVRAATRPYPGAFWDAGDKIVRIWSGKIGDAATEVETNAFRLILSDGVYDAIDFEFESHQ